MAAKKKTVKKAAVKKAVAKKPIKKIVKPAKKVRKPAKKVRKLAKPESVVEVDTSVSSTLPIPKFYISQIFADHMAVFGLANDQRVYRWNPRAGVWVLHKEGEQP